MEHYQDTDESRLPVEIMLKERILGNGTGVFMVAGVAVVGTHREIEVCNMRGEVLRSIRATEINEWITRHHYRYVPRTQAAYHREAPRARVPAAPMAALPAPEHEAAHT